MPNAMTKKVATAVHSVAIKKWALKPGLKNYSYFGNLSCVVFEMILFIIPYMPIISSVPSPMENVSGCPSTTSLKRTYTKAKMSMLTITREKYITKIGFIVDVFTMIFQYRAMDISL